MILNELGTVADASKMFQSGTMRSKRPAPAKKNTSGAATEKKKSDRARNDDISIFHFPQMHLSPNRRHLSFG
jgi:hypothetical protein